jgi:hypothetical protein
MGDVRILIACAMKSGSTFVSRALAAYFDAFFIEPLDYWGRREQNLMENQLAPHLAKPFVMQMHLRPHAPNMEIIRRLGIRVIYLWRNLGDVVVSFDDHIRNEDHRNPVGYIHDRARYLALPEQHRYRYLIDHALPWYAAFHLSWRNMDVARASYEHLAADPQGFFEQLIGALGHRPDARRIERILDRRIEGARFNVGVAGRSSALLSEQTQRRLDDFLLLHPEDLAELWAELPWRATGRPAAGSLLRALAACVYNGRAGTLEPAFPGGLRLRLEDDGFWFQVPGPLLAPSRDRTARVRLVVRGEAGSAFRLESRRSKLETPYRPSAAPSTVEFLLNERHADVEEFRLHCFNGLKRRATAEILECVKIEA